MPASTQRSVSKSELIYQKLKASIIGGEYRVGHRLVLDRIAQEYSVSALPVREAIRRLEAEGLITFIPNVGAEVSGFDKADYGEAMQVLSFLEGAATALAAPHLTEDDIARARAINREMDATRRDFDPKRFTALNHEFHRVICSKCTNGRVRDLLEKEWERLHMMGQSSFTFVPGRAATSIAEHDHILQAIVDGRPPEYIEQLARHHKLNTMDAFLAAASTS
jgi:DNA-binding GntR family transcriptional regulator